MIPTREQIGQLGNTGAQILEMLGGEGSSSQGGVTIPQALEDIADAIKNMRVPEIITEKDVNFIDYDGTIDASFTAEEFAALAEMPKNPKHDGLISQGWNWTLEDAQEYVAAHGKLYIGQTYVTDNGKTRLHIDVYHRLVKRFRLGLAVNGTVEIDWGDGSERTTLTQEDRYLRTYIMTEPHEYPATGKYTIEIDVTEGSAALFSMQSVKTLFAAPEDPILMATNRIYCNMLTGLEIGNNMTVKSTLDCGRLRTVIIPPVPGCLEVSAFSSRKEIKAIIIPSGFTEIASSDFAYIQGLEYVSLPKSIETIGSDAFRETSLRIFMMPPNVTSVGNGALQSCGELEEVYLPDAITRIGTYMFYLSSNLETVTLPENLTSIGDGAFQLISGLITITIPSRVETIGQNAFASCISLREMHFKSASPPEAGAGAFSSLQTHCKIYVPAGSLSAYTSAANYPDSSTFTYIEE